MLAMVTMLAGGCRGDRAPAGGTEPTATTPRHAAGATTPRTIVLALPQSPDGAQELVALDLQITQGRTANDPEALIPALSRRAMLRGRHEDFREALARSLAWTHDDNQNPHAWAVRISILTQAHQFSQADRAFADLEPLAHDPSEWEPLAATLFEARGTPERARDYRERAATIHPTAGNLTHLAANLAMRGQLDEAIAMIPRAAAALRDPSPVLVAWLLVQWGRLYVQRGEPAAARQLFEEAHRRMPGYVEATVQLGAAIRATGGDPREVAAAALAAEPQHPELLALAGRTADAHQAWAVYLTYPLEEAFADHAARFYLGAGRDPGKALRLAATNFTNRQTIEARSLLVEARLTNAMWKEACHDAQPLATGTRTQQFLAWRAFTACSQTAEADRLAQTLGIR
jgi:tetratricopeptide (TPR) repeat protein